MTLIHLALANIRRGKGAAFSLFILILLAALLLNVGLTVILKINSFYDEKVEQLQGAHVSTIVNSKDYQQPEVNFLESAEEIETEDILIMAAAKYRYGASDYNFDIAILNMDINRKIAPLHLVGKSDEFNVADDIVYLPYSYQANGGYELGDTITINLQDNDYSYRVAGFFEATILGTNDMGMVKFFLPNEAYQRLANKLGEEADGILMSAIFDDRTKSPQLLYDYRNQYPQEVSGTTESFSWSADILITKNVSTLTINIVAMILVAFATVIVLVSLIVIKFRVTNSIDDGIINIGVLKAIGYTSRQILASVIMQFMLITLCAGVIGVLLSYLVMPVFGGIISSLSGLIWIQSFNAGINLASIFIVTLLVLTVTLLSSLRIEKLHPVIALRGGLITHSFKKNRFPLETAKGGLQFALACKTMMTNSKQNIMITVIIIAITFASIFSIVLYYNVAVDKKAFIHLVGVETSNVVVTTKSGMDINKLIMDIEHMEGVTKTATLDIYVFDIGNENVYVNISDDYNKLDNNLIFEGRYPLYDNEIALSWVVAEQMDVVIGDTVNVELGDAQKPYLVTGLSQAINNMGQTASLTTLGVQQLIPDYSGTQINVYLTGTDNASFIQEVQARYGDRIQDAINLEETVDNESDVYISAVFAVMVLILAITVMVVALILYLVIKTMILKRLREFGILKAIGYTTYQLMTQIAQSFVPIVIAGVMIGGVLGCLYTNTVLTVLLSSAGIHKVQFIVNIPIIALLCIGLIVLAYLVSMIVSYRIKRVTAYGLITE